MTLLTILMTPETYGCGDGDLHCKVFQTILPTESCIWFGRPRCRADSICSADYSYPFMWLRYLISLFKPLKHKMNVRALKKHTQKV